MNMSLNRWDKWRRIALLVGLATIVAIGVCTSCKSGLGVVSSLTVHPSADISTSPVVLARYDGNTFVGWANGTGAVEVYGQATGFPLYGPITLPAGRVIVHVANPKFSWEGGTHDRLPMEAKPIFRDAEIAAWGLAFGPLPVP